MALLVWQRAVRAVRANLVGFGLVIGVVAILSFNVYRSQDRELSSAEVEGTLRGVHVQQGYAGTSTLFAVALTSGEVVLVRPPDGTKFKENARVTLVRHGTAHGNQDFSFKSYVP